MTCMAILHHSDWCPTVAFSLQALEVSRNLVGLMDDLLELHK